MADCRYCGASLVKAGKRPSGIQRYKCRLCGRYQQIEYRYNAYAVKCDKLIVELLCEGLGIRSIARILSISPVTVLRRVLFAGNNLKRPSHDNSSGDYEMDEMWTYVGSKAKPCWVIYAIDKKDKRVVDFRLGRRTQENIGAIVEPLLRLKPSRIATDRLNVYPSLIPKNMHVTNKSSTLNIERNNLNLRTHLKRLSRKTIVYSKSQPMLEAALKLYFWRKLDVTGSLLR